MPTAAPIAIAPRTISTLPVYPALADPTGFPNYLPKIPLLLTLKFIFGALVFSTARPDEKCDDLLLRPGVIFDSLRVQIWLQ